MEFSVKNILTWGLEVDRRYGGYKLPVSFKYKNDVVDTINTELLLRDLYYSPKVGYRSPEHLFELAKKEDENISKYFVKQWLLKQSAYTRFKKYNRPKHFRHTLVRDFDQLQMDIVFMLKHEDENDGYKYILVAIEILSRFAFAVPQKEKSGKVTKTSIELILEKFLERFGKYPKLVQFDEGVEFLNKDVKLVFDSLDITYFTTHSPKKAAIVERLNRTLKTKMTRMFEKEKNHEWVEHLQDLVDNYNDSFHRSIA